MAEGNNIPVREELPTPPGMNPKGTPVTADEQAIFEQLETNAMKVVYSDPEVTDMMFRQMEKLRDQPPKAVAMGAKMAMDEAKKQTKNVSPEMITRATATTVDHVGNLANLSGLFEIDDEGKKQALQFVLGNTIKEATQAGEINPDSLLNFTVGHARRANKMKLADQKKTEEK